LANIVSDLAQSSLQPSSIPTYKQAWTLFTQFHIKNFNNGIVALPISPSVIALFIAYLFDLKYAPSTVNTYVSAIGYSHRLSGFPDPTRVFYIVQILKGYGKTGFRLDSRLPITLSILNRIIEASPHIAGSQYQICQFKAMCSLAFFAFLRIGELTMITSNNQPLQMHQLSHIYDTNNQITGIKLTFENFKHNYNQQPFSLEIYRQSMICPVQLLSDYLVLCGSRPGAIFISHLQYRVTHLLLNFRGLFGIVVWTLQNTNLINLELALLPMQLRTDILMRKFVR
jgi:hypothetical protein